MACFWQKPCFHLIIKQNWNLSGALWETNKSKKCKFNIYTPTQTKSKIITNSEIEIFSKTKAFFGSHLQVNNTLSKKMTCNYRQKLLITENKKQLNVTKHKIQIL